MVTAMADSCYGIGLMLGPAIGGELHVLGGFALPFLVEGIGVLLQAGVVHFAWKEVGYEKFDDNNENQDQTGVTWLNVMTAQPIFLRQG